MPFTIADIEGMIRVSFGSRLRKALAPFVTGHDPVYRTGAEYVVNAGYDYGVAALEDTAVVRGRRVIFDDADKETTRKVLAAFAQYHPEVLLLVGGNKGDPSED